MYDLAIPGQVSEYQLRAIESVAARVPHDGRVVEVGALFGRSSFAWSQSSDQSVRVYSLDPWENNEGVRGMERQYGITYGIDQFKTFTRDCTNLTPLQGYSPNDFQDWADPIDVYYEDAVHTNPVLHRNLTFWVGFLKSDGLVCGDDYRPRFPDVINEVNLLKDRLRAELVIVDFFWVLIPPGYPGEQKLELVEELNRIQSDCDYFFEQHPFQSTIQLLSDRVEAEPNDEFLVKLRITNEARKQWGSWSKEWSIVVELWSDEEVSYSLARIPIEPRLFPPDLAREMDISCTIPNEARQGDYRIRVGAREASGALSKGVRAGGDNKTFRIR